MCVSKKRNLWLWVAVSRYTGQILAFEVGRRTRKCLARLWAKVPEPWKRRLVYTDGLDSYAAFFPRMVMRA